MSNPFRQPTKVYMYALQPTRLAIMTEGPTEQEAGVIAQHWRYLQDLSQREILIFAGRTLTTDENSFASAVFRADSEDAAKAIMQGDPTVQHGLMRAKLYPYQVLIIGRATS